MKIPSLPANLQELGVKTTQEFNLGKFSFQPTYFQALLMIALVFLFILFLGQFRRHLVGWQLKGILPGIFFGFILVLVLEGMFIVGGKTIMTELLGWENPPKPIANALDAGRNKLVKVLGITDEIPVSFAGENESSLDQIILNIDSLPDEDKEILKQNICLP